MLLATVRARKETKHSGADSWRPGQQILLRHPGIRISGRWFIVGSRRYDIAELSHLRMARGRHDPMTTRAVVTGGVVLAAIAVVMVVPNVGRPVQSSAVPALGAALLVPVVLAWVGHRLRHRPYELWVEYRGTTIKIFSSDSEREYGQVCRALVRAREIARLGGAGEPRANLDPWGIPRSAGGKETSPAQAGNQGNPVTLRCP